MIRPRLLRQTLPWALSLAALSALCDSSTNQEASHSPDHVGFPKDYPQVYEVVRLVCKTNEHKIVTVYGNRSAASVTNAAQLPYPFGSIFVMESARILEDTAGKLLLEANGAPKKGAITGLHVMRREPGFGKAYGTNQAGDWEFVEYKPDGSYLTAPEKSGSCAECHVKAGKRRDFVYRGRLEIKE